MIDLIYAFVQGIRESLMGDQPVGRRRVIVLGTLLIGVVVVGVLLLGLLLLFS